MISNYKGNYNYLKEAIERWNSGEIGVYYCGYLANGLLNPVYIGSATGEFGIKGRLLQHLNEDIWPDATHFGYITCSSAQEALDLEANEILKYNPKYNKQLNIFRAK